MQSIWLIYQTSSFSNTVPCRAWLVYPGDHMSNQFNSSWENHITKHISLAQEKIKIPNSKYGFWMYTIFIPNRKILSQIMIMSQAPSVQFKFLPRGLLSKNVDIGIKWRNFFFWLTIFCLTKVFLIYQHKNNNHCVSSYKFKLYFSEMSKTSFSSLRHTFYVWENIQGPSKYL